MAIDPLNGNSRIANMADLWAQKIRANKEAKDTANSTAVAPDGKIRVTNAKGMKVGQTEEPESSENDDHYTRQIKELQRQLKRVMEQIARVRDSNASAEQKATQMQTLNGQAVQIMNQIQQVLAAKAKAMAKATGGVAATA
ncbi:FlxA-like family protein [Achromobacter sp. UMC71]|uniref:FlxA-like family protein n=1 Tax=Achromobacter sp. UMC71 TaxID=1862320 RepID=UPI0016034F7A|nr:FlxA-like family protein [Achromobacter sp. UMC71]MBB1628420.1 hypothetical protein [Achromobacter sp. UMC71]